MKERAEELPQQVLDLSIELELLWERIKLFNVHLIVVSDQDFNLYTHNTVHNSPPIWASEDDEKELSEYLLNLTMEESAKIDSACFFQDLKAEVSAICLNDLQTEKYT